jgi:hypothetical protein
MNRYLTQLAQDLSFIMPDEWQDTKIDVYEDENTETGEDASEYMLFIPISELNNEICRMAIGEETDAYWYVISYQADTDLLYVNILGDEVVEEVAEVVDPDTIKMFKDHMKKYAKEYKENKV